MMTLSGSVAAEDATVHAAVVMADITGSTPLYEREGNEAAATAINARLARMRQSVAEHRGVFVSAKGDDVLCWFPDATDALDAAAAMVALRDASGLMVHAGAQWGAFVRREGDIFGGCVNTAARLCALAKPGEILLGEDLYVRLTPARHEDLTEIAPLQLKGKETPTRLFSRLTLRQGGGARTVIGDFLAPPRTGAPAVEARFFYNFAEFVLRRNAALTLGRAEENAVTIPEPSVSRQHATISVNNGLVEYADHSSTGSYLVLEDGTELSILRRAVVLSGTGTIALGPVYPGNERPLIRFEVGGGGP